MMVLLCLGAGSDRLFHSLSAMALRAEAALRHGDVVGRYGGEEFLALLPATDAIGAMRVAEYLRQLIAAGPFILPSGQPLTVTVSIGVATTREVGHDRVALLHAADLALYQAKEAGRDRVRHSPQVA